MIGYLIKIYQILEKSRIDLSNQEKKLYESILNKLDELSKIDSEKSYTDEELNLMVHKYFVSGELE